MGNFSIFYYKNEILVEHLVYFNQNKSPYRPTLFFLLVIPERNIFFCFGLIIQPTPEKLHRILHFSFTKISLVVLKQCSCMKANGRSVFCMELDSIKKKKKKKKKSVI